jgi:hypothetical protein
LVRFPRLGAAYVRAKWFSEQVAPRLKRFSDAPGARTLLTLILLHPFFSVRHVLPHIRITRSKDAPEPAAAIEDDETATFPDESAPDEPESDLEEILLEAEQAYLNRQVVSAGVRLSDAHTFGGPDRDEDGFVRLMLRESYHDFALPGSDEKHRVVFEPRLLLHNSGILQLDLVLRADTTLDTRQALAMMWGPQPLFVTSEMSRPLLRGTQWEPMADYSSGEVDAGQPLGLIVHPAPVAMSDLLAVHMDAVLRVVKRAYKHWIIYPVSIIDVEECCSPGEWKTNHRDDLIRLAIRGSIDRQVAEHVSVPRDLSLGHDHSLYAGLGSAAYMQWTGTSPRGMAELDTALVLEYALLQYMRLNVMEEQVARMVLGERRLHARYREAIRLFSELRQRDLRAGEAREIVRHVHHDLGVPEIRQTVETALNLSSSAHATQSAERSSRRAWWVTFAATLVALLVAVPPLRDLLRSVPAAESGEPWPLVPLRWLAEQGFLGPWLAMGGVFAIVLALFLLGVLWRWRLRRLPSMRRGYKWPVEFTAATDDYSPSAPGPRSRTLSAEFPAVNDHVEESGSSATASLPDEFPQSTRGSIERPRRG